MRIFLLILLLFSSPAFSSEVNGVWRWYYVGYNSPELGSNVFLRSGLSSVTLSKGVLSSALKDFSVQELKPVLNGSIEGAKVKASLSGFFMHADKIEFNGFLRKKRFPGGCVLQEIALYPKIPDGSFFMLNKISPNCS